MKLGADRKRLAVLGVLVLVGGYVVWNTFFSSPEESGGTAVRTRPNSIAAAPDLSSSAPETSRTPARRRERTRASEWNPAYRGTKPLNPLQVDPTLRLDLLAKVQRVPIEPAGRRNLFLLGEAPKPVDKTPLPNPGKINTSRNQPPATPPGPTKPPEPVAPPINLKYYGYASPRNNPNKRVFFLDGDDIIVASEGESIKGGRYKLIKVGVNSVTMEDTQFKSQQTLPLAEEAVG